MQERRSLNRKTLRMLDGSNDNSVFLDPTEGRTGWIRR